ncbi:MAG: T9SS type A sorting domain-containing protein [Candidatus Cloacimonetes bacterium]|nr:T9SS type A sorting domain-containing protein [Candidatus Cloacimonadota bacterium]
MKRFFLVIPLMFSMLSAIVSIPGDGRIMPNDRLYHFNYHNSVNDLQLYGAQKWAVKFNFRQVYPGMTDVSFNVAGVRLWFPNIGDSATVELYSDSNNQPGSRIISKSAPITDNLTDIYFDQETEQETVWLIVSYRTNMLNRYVAASYGGGTNSYFLNEVNDQFYLSSLALAGFNCELLFGLLGDYEFDTADIALTDFDIIGDVQPGGRVYPVFSIYNHGNVSIEQAEVEITMNRPGEAQYEGLTISVPSIIEPHTEYVYDGGYQFITLPQTPTQLRIEALLSSEYVENDILLANNSVSKSYNVFTDRQPILLVENFLQQVHYETMNSLQDQYLTRDTDVLTYYPILSDSLANLSAQQRFNWYSFNALPQTVIHGEHTIVGLTQSYEQLFADYMGVLSEPTTFISSSNCRMDAVEGSENIYLSINLENTNTDMYTGVTQSLMSSSRLFAGVFAKPIIQSADKFCLLKWVAFADTINSALTINQNIDKHYTISASGLFDNSSELHYRLYFWLQDKDGGAIYYANFSDFDPLLYVSNTDELAPTAAHFIYPNPLKLGGSLKISIPDLSLAKISLYNIKGQMIDSKTNIRGEVKLNSDLFPSSGIYFIRIEQEGKKPIHKKISIIK